MSGVQCINQIDRPLKKWSLKFKDQIHKKLFKRHSSMLILDSNGKETTVTESNKIYSQQSSDFGLVTARLGLLFNRLASGAQIQEEDLSLIGEGQKYFNELLTTLENMQKGASYELLSQHLKSFSSLDNSTQKFQSLGSVESLKSKAKNMLMLLDKRSLDQESLKDLAKLFITISGWTLESDAAKFFSKTNANELKFIV